ncbi:beta-ketoacyl synthase family protein [Dictyostelium discoideum AX4]|uniref:Beta-ketoacyl synthase family protein n=1 Tax=Dictyostelium discoideum TaxID=44689 RepID=Q54EB2_DICDI|nr:beta-ketoacyl synthase family protein [Dictyostelium discoideum AX4]EAL61786.1 beta-ketoacyl synthase family protein [Dictyostelium discoideum AX4]|eukprot:XP_635328.1 beta-ketoacyl synthase family protein [Dictyostelium discoideum AX4]
MENQRIYNINLDLLKDNTLNGKNNYYPSTYLIEELIKIFQNTDLIIPIFEFKPPFIIDNELEKFYLQTEIIEINSKEYEIKFNFKDNKTNQWNQFSKGNFLLSTNNNYNFNEKEVDYIENLKSKICNFTKVSKDEFINFIDEKTGLKYNGIFNNNIKDCLIGDNCSLLVVSLEGCQNQNLFFNKPLFNIFLSGMLILVDRKCKLNFNKIEGLKYYSPNNLPKDKDQLISEIYIYSKLISSKTISSNSYSASVKVLLPDGTLLFDIDRVEYKSLTSIKPISIEPPNDHMYSVYQQPLNSLIKSPLKFKSKYQNKINDLNHFLNYQDGSTSNYNDFITIQNQIISNIVKEVIKPILNEKILFRILDFQGEINSTTIILEKINSLFGKFPNFQIDIEYTINNKNPPKNSIPIKFDKIFKENNLNNICIVIKDFNLVKDQFKNGENNIESYYDFIIISNLNLNENNLKSLLLQINQLLTPNGHLLLMEFKSKISFNKNNLEKLLIECNYCNDFVIFLDDSTPLLLIHTQKQNIQLFKNISISNDSEQILNNLLFENIIIFGNNNNIDFKLIYKNNENYKSIYQISKINEINEKLITDKSIIYFIKTIDKLLIENFNEITFEYIQINQMIMKLNSKCKHVLLAKDIKGENYLSSSVIGVSRYFDQIPQLELFTIDFDNNSIDSIYNVINELINSKINWWQKEFTIKNNEIYFEIFKKESKFINNIFKSNSYEKNHNEMITKKNYKIVEKYLGNSILITGQSGFVLEIYKWIINYSESVKNIIILSKSKLKWELELLIKKNKHINFIFKSIDVGNTNAMEETINIILKENSNIINIDSIFHFAVEYCTTPDPLEITIKNLEISNCAKTMGAINLHNQSVKRNWKLINFIMASSVASLFGVNSQCSYSSSCYVIDSLSAYRKSIGLPSICTNYGVLGEAGLCSRVQMIQDFTLKLGYEPLPANMVLGALDLQIQNQNIVPLDFILSKLNFNLFKNSNQRLLKKFDFLFNSVNIKKE